MPHRTASSILAKGLTISIFVVTLISRSYALPMGSVMSNEPPDPERLDQAEVAEPDSITSDEGMPEAVGEPKDEVTMMPSIMAPRVHEEGNFNAKGETEALHWKSGNVFLEPGIDPKLVALQAGITDGSTGNMRHAYVVVQYEWEPTTDQAAEVLAWGYEELEYIPENGFIVRVPVDKLTALAEQRFVHAVAPLRPEWKLDPDLGELMNTGRGAPLAVGLVAFEPLELSGESPLMRIGESLNYKGELTPDEIVEYLNAPLIKWIEPAHVDRASLATSVDVMAADNVHTIENLDGTGVKVGVIDSGIDDAHSHFASIDIVFAWDWVGDDNDPIDDCNGHGTNVAGVIAGESTFNEQTLTAVAPGATLIIERVFDCEGGWPNGSYDDVFDEVADQGADVINNSWGHDSDEEYDAEAHEVDDWAHDHEDVVLVFANGNGCDPYLAICDDDAQSPGLAKNVIAVGATEDGSPIWPNGEAPDALSADDIDLVSDLNNLDLPEDGRTKPDINAPGEWVTIPALGGGYETEHGSSLAAPHVSGLIALYLQEYPGQRADKVKAALINSAAYLGNKPGQTGYAQGWGRATAYDFIYQMPGEAVDSIFDGEVGDTWPYQEEESFPFTVPGGAEYVKVTMTYLDRAGLENANLALVNNLDLRLQSPSGTDYYSNSEVDNVEQIYLNSPDLEAGTWTVYVRAHSIPGITHISQKYAGNISVVVNPPSLSYSVPSSVSATQGVPFEVSISTTASDWFAYGVYTLVEVLDPAIQLASGSQSADVIGDMWSETRNWTPSFVATGCGTFTDAIRVTMGATNFDTATNLVTVNVQCPSEPHLEVEPSLLNFTVEQGQSATQSFYVSNVGGGTLSWQAVEDPEESWLNLYPTSGSSVGEPDPVNVTVDTSGLNAGDTKTGRITITSNDGSDHVDIVVSVGGNQAPQLTSDDLDPPDGNTGDNTLFTYDVQYRDQDNDAPVTRQIVIDGQPYTMSSDDTTYDDGAVFTFQRTAQQLGVGNHTYHFFFTDGQGGSARLPASGEKIGPLVASGEPWMWVSEPDGIDDLVITTVDPNYTITWTATDPDGDPLSIALYYSVAKDTGSMNLIASGLPNTGSYTWDTLSVPEGSYYIYGVSDDGHGQSDFDWSAGLVTISHSESPPSTKTWLSPQQLSTGGSRPAIALGLDEAVHVVWESGGIFYINSQDGGLTWSAPRQICSAADCREPELVTDSDGNVHVVWELLQESANLEIYYEKLDSQGNTLIDDRRLTNASRHSFSPDVCIDPSGVVHVVWTDGRNTPPEGQMREEVYYKKSLDGGANWSSDQSIANNGTSFCEYYYPSVACDSNNVYVVYQDDWDEFVLFVRGANSGTLWGSPVRIDQGGSVRGYAERPRIAVDGYGLHVVFEKGRSNNAAYKKSTDAGNTWSDDWLITVSGEQLRPDIAVSENGMYVVNQGDDILGAFLESLNGGTTWSIPEQFIDGSYPKVDANSEGVHIVWYTDSGISYRRTELLSYPPAITITMPPSEGASADSTYTINWTGSDPNPDDTLTVDLYYDVDQDPSAKNVIALGLDNSGAHTWDTTECVKYCETTVNRI